MGKRITRFAPPFLDSVIEVKCALELAPDSYCMTPEDLEREELEAYAAEYANSQDLPNLDITTDDFSAWSDIEDASMGSLQLGSDKAGRSSADRDMDLS